MNTIEYRRSWSSNETQEEQMTKEFGTLLVEFDESDGWDEDEGKLFKKGRKYNVLFANGCSCWDGDWDGWGELTKTELKKMAKTWAEKSYNSSEKKLGTWVQSNL